MSGATLQTQAQYTQPTAVVTRVKRDLRKVADAHQEFARQETVPEFLAYATATLTAARTILETVPQSDGRFDDRGHLRSATKQVDKALKEGTLDGEYSSVYRRRVLRDAFTSVRDEMMNETAQDAMMKLVGLVDTYARMNNVEGVPDVAVAKNSLAVATTPKGQSFG